MNCNASGLRHEGLKSVSCQLLSLGFVVLITLLTSPVRAQGVFDSVLDRMGHKYALRSIAVNDTVRNPDSIIVNTVSTCSSGYYQLYFEIGSGMEDMGNSTHAARRAVLCQVLNDLSAFINSPLSTTGKKVNIWVRARSNVSGDGATPAYGSSFYAIPNIASMAGIADNVAWTTIHAGADGFTNTADPYQISYGTSANSFFHIILTFDFSTSTWNTNLAAAPASSDYDLYSYALKLMTTSLGIVSEIKSDGTSLLGNGHYSRYDQFLTTHSGTPLITNTGSYGTYANVFNPALTAANILSPNTSLCVTDSTDCDTSVIYSGGVTIPVYTPNCYESGFSLSYFEDECTGTPSVANNNQYFVMSNITEPGTMKRYLKAEERTVLCDLGYEVGTAFGNSANLNDHSYGGSGCAGIEVSGINDGYDVNGAAIYFSSTTGEIQINGNGLPAGIPGLLDNDINADAFEGLEVLNGTGTFNVTSGNSTTVVKYTPGSSEFGPVLVRYIPYNSTTGKRGNNTYAAFLISHDPNCTPTNCELVVNGNFSTTTNCGVIHSTLQNSNHLAAEICNWSNYSGTPDLYVVPSGIPSDPCMTNRMYGLPTWPSTIPFLTSIPSTSVVVTVDVPVPSPAGTQFVGMYSVRQIPIGLCGGSWHGEAIQTQLAAPLIPGMQYTLSFDARVAIWTPEQVLHPVDYNDVALQFYVTPGTPLPPAWDIHCPFPNFAATLPSPPMSTLLPTTDPLSGTGFIVPADLPKTANQWHHFNHVFMYSGAAALSPTTAQWLVVQANPELTAAHLGTTGTPSATWNYNLITNISLTPVVVPATFTVCASNPFTVPAFTYSNTGTSVYVAPTESYTWTPTTGLSCSICPAPTATVTAGVHTYSMTGDFYRCSSTVTVTADPSPTVTGTYAVCVGNTVAITTYAPAGGTWVSGNTAVGTVNTTTGVVGGISSGVVPISYLVAGSYSCPAIVMVTVNALPTITGTLSVCTGGSTSLSSPSGAGTWSVTGSVVTVNSSGVVSAGSYTGTATVTFTNSATGCSASVVVSVIATPSISGTLTVCSGLTTSLGGSPPGGTWTISGPATVSSSGVVTGGLPAGMALVTYSLGSCSVSATVTVNATPAAISGPATICVGETKSYTVSPPILGATWSSSNSTIASVTAMGNVTGNSPGTAIISYTAAGCSSTKIVTVLALPIVSGTSVCAGGTATLTGTPTGGTWSGGVAGIALIGSTSGVVTGDPAVTVTSITTISYTAGGCTAYATVTVEPIPTMTTVPTICAGDTHIFTVSPTGGTWSSSDASVATVGTAGDVTGVYTVTSTSTVTVTYTSPAVCSTSAVVTVVPLPVITGTLSVCSAGIRTLTVTPTGGTWTSSSPAIASVNPLTLSTVEIIGGVPGTATITYTPPSGICPAVVTFTVDPIPTITGTFSVCAGATTTPLTGSPSGGTWTSSDGLVATVDASGAVTGTLTGTVLGTAIISYISPAGCLATEVFTVHPTPPFTTSPSPLEICSFTTATLTPSIPGGTWSSSVMGVGIITPATGILTGTLPTTATVSATTVLTYTLTTGCAASVVATVDPIPVIAGGPTVCEGATITMSVTNGVTGGLWSSSTGAPPVDATTGIVTGSTAAGDVSDISYTVTGTGCSASISVTVVATPAAITGVLHACEGGFTSTLSTTSTGGTWTSSNLAVGIIGSLTGIVTTGVAGTTTIDYTYPNGCSSSAVFTVDPNPTLDGTTEFCLGGVYTMTVTNGLLGGTWSTPVTVPPVVTVGSGTGVVTGGGVGTALISYILPTGCFATFATSVHPVPAAITPANPHVCISNTLTLSSTPAGGTWMCTTPPPLGPTIVTVTGGMPAIITPSVVGTTMITYTLPNGCFETTGVTVDPQPTPIIGNDVLCVGATTVMVSGPAGGVWMSSNPGIGTIDPVTGVLGGVFPGVINITYAFAGSCVVTKTVTIYPGGTCPCAIFGSASFTEIPDNSIITTDLGPGNYFVAGTFSVSGSVKITDAVMAIAPNGLIFVDGSSKLTVEGSHLFACSDMWQGIVLYHTFTTLTNGVAKITSSPVTGNSSLIEDARVGVWLDPCLAPSMGTYLIETDDAIFNKCFTGLYIAYSSGITNRGQFKFQNTIFTSRDLFPAPFVFPDQWPNTMTGTVPLKASGPTLPAGMAGYIDDYKLTSYFAGRAPNLPFPPAQYQIGIEVTSFGSGTSYGFLDVGMQNTHQPTAASTNNWEQNVFDTLNYGIYALNSNVRSRNNAYVRMRFDGWEILPNQGGVGIYAKMDDATQYSLDIDESVYTPTNDPPIISTNYFYNNRWGVYCRDYWGILGKHAVMATIQNTNPSYHIGYEAISASFIGAQFDNNTMYNVENGIKFGADYGYYSSAPVGWISANDNHIWATTTFGGMPVWQHVSNAIDICQGIVMGSPYYPYPPTLGTTNTSNNDIQYAYRGINISGNMNQIATAYANTITTTYEAAGVKSFGINHTFCRKSEIVDNWVIGVDVGVSTVTPTSDQVSAYVCESNSNEFVSCNHAINTGWGYEFRAVPNVGTNWHGNKMDGNKYGMVLNNSLIGPQGTTGDAMNNHWVVPSWWTTSPRLHTYVLGVPIGCMSPLHFVGSGDTDPFNNSGTPLSSVYGVCTGGLDGLAPSISECGVHRDIPTTEPYEQIARRDSMYSSDSNAHEWVNQLLVWQAINVDSGLVDSSVVLDSFSARAAISRFGYLTGIEAALANGDLTTASSLLATSPLPLSCTGLQNDPTTGVRIMDYPSVNYLVANQKTFYTLLLHHLNNTWCGWDNGQLEIIASECPSLYGSVVYKARALYKMRNHVIRQWADTCGGDTASFGMRLMTTTAVTDQGRTLGTQQYNLFPNPNDGHLTLQQLVEDNEIVGVEVYDIVGRSIFRDNVRFITGSYKLNLQDLSPGMYVMKIKDNKERLFNFKFVVQ